MIKLEHISSGYGSATVLSDINLLIESGERVAVLGRNGVGKTTLLRTLIGEIGVIAGDLYFEGASLRRMPAHARARLGIGYVPQGRNIFAGLSVEDNLKVAAYGANIKDWRETYKGVLDRFPMLAEKARLDGAGLSGGQQQILALGRALMTRPKLLLLDEPSEGIQPSIVDQIARDIRRINEDDGITVIIVEQNLEFAAKVADRAYLLDKGRVMKTLPMGDLLSSRPLQQEFLGV